MTSDWITKMPYGSCLLGFVILFFALPTNHPLSVYPIVSETDEPNKSHEPGADSLKKLVVVALRRSLDLG
jgi:hypothetical protein